MFRSKVRESPDNKQLSPKENIITTIATFEKPKICCYDVSKDLIKCLSDMHYHVYEGSLGKIVKVENSPGSGHFCLLNYKNPANAHEYDVFIFDMSENDEIDFNQADHQKKRIRTEKDIYLYCSYPMNVFDPRAYSSRLINQSIQYNLSKKRLVITFADEFRNTKYFIAEKKDRFAEIQNEETVSNYSFMPSGFSYSSNKTGKNIKISITNQTLVSILSKHLKSMEYHITFDHPIRWNNNTSEKDKNFIPLLLNEVDEVVGFFQILDNIWLLVLPFVEKKELLIKDLFMSFLPDVLPDLFPEDEKHNWKNREEYFLPNHKLLLEEELEIKKRYEKELEDISIKIKKNTSEYSYLHDLLTFTGD